MMVKGFFFGSIFGLSSVLVHWTIGSSRFSLSLAQSASSAFFVTFSAPPQSLLLSRACCGAEVRSEALSRLRLWSMACDEGRVESLCEPCVLETLTKFLGGGDAGLKFSAASALLAMATSARGCAFLKESTFSERLETLETLTSRVLG